MKYCKNCKKSRCNNNYKAEIVATTLTTNAITPLILNNECDNCCGIIIANNSIIFNHPGVYSVSGYVNITNQSTGLTNVAVMANILSNNNNSVINPNSITYSGIKINLPYTGSFDFIVQVNMPNTVLQLTIRSTSTPTIISCGKIKIARMV